MATWGFFRGTAPTSSIWSRELQAIDPRVALPYWKFDEAAPFLFSLDFMGLPNAAGRLEFAIGHPLESWTTDGQLGIVRSMWFAPNDAPPGLRSEPNTLALGSSYGGFSSMEIKPSR